MKKGCLTLLVLALAMAFALFYFGTAIVRGGIDTTGVPGLHAYFPMPYPLLKMIKGTPLQTRDSREWGNMMYYIYQDQILDTSCTVTYGFMIEDGWLSPDTLYNVELSFDGLEKQQGKDLFDDLILAMKAAYQNRAGYYDDGCKETETTLGEMELHADFGTDRGAGGVSVYMTLTDTRLFISIGDMW